MNPLRFSRLWRDATRSPPPNDRILGPWEGSWRSDGGHRGRLRCIVRSVHGGELDATFHAVYWKIFRITCEPTLSARPDDDGYVIVGAWSLGVFGHFEYDGRITPARFRARYRSSSDEGTLDLTRPR